MATNFPTGLDTLSNPVSTNALNSPSHAGQHTDANDAIEALQTKVGVNNSMIASSLDYKVANLGKRNTFSPAWDSYGSPSLGSGSVLAYYTLVNDLLTIVVDITMASDTTDEFENPRFTLPNGMSWVSHCYGWGIFTQYQYTSHMMVVLGESTSVSTSSLSPSGSPSLVRDTGFLPSWSSGGEHPFSNGDRMRYSITGIIS
jgi:hypothetical protein